VYIACRVLCSEASDARVGVGVMVGVLGLCAGLGGVLRVVLALFWVEAAGSSRRDS